MPEAGAGAGPHDWQEQEAYLPSLPHSGLFLGPPRLPPLFHLPPSLRTSTTSTPAVLSQGTEGTHLVRWQQGTLGLLVG